MTTVLIVILALIVGGFIALFLYACFLEGWR